MAVSSMKKEEQEEDYVKMVSIVKYLKISPPNLWKWCYPDG